jgi:hypothetical protein
MSTGNAAIVALFGKANRQATTAARSSGAIMSAFDASYAGGHVGGDEAGTERNGADAMLPTELRTEVDRPKKLGLL